MTRAKLLLVGATWSLALAVIALGAYTRLTDAGLGCPDWPGCYGQWIVPMTEEAKVLAVERYPEQVLEPQKAWNEMIHRYLASCLGLMIIVIAAVLWRQVQGYQRNLCAFLVLLVMFQGFLGMLTVTLALMPVVVVGHLLGGFCLFSALSVLFASLLRQNSRWNENNDTRRLKRFRCADRARLSNDMNENEVQRNPNWLSSWLNICVGLLVVQIALGGWTSANYAALSCVEFPICHASWSQNFSIIDALAIPSSHQSYEFGVKAEHARMSIHVMHRLGAIIVVSWFGLFLLRCYIDKPLQRRIPLIIASLLSLQVLLGISNIALLLPIGIAVSHNLVACLLLAACVTWRVFLVRAANDIEEGNDPPVFIHHASSKQASIDASSIRLSVSEAKTSLLTTSEIPIPESIKK